MSPLSLTQPQDGSEPRPKAARRLGVGFGAAVLTVALLVSGLLACGPSSTRSQDAERATDDACRMASIQAEQILHQVTRPAPPWSAHWIGPGDNRINLWACYRTTFNLGSVPPSAPTRIAADSKYWLWVNGVLVVREGGVKRGPAPQETYYDVLDLAPYLRPGANTLAVLHWYFGKDGFSHSDSSKAALIFEMEAGNVRIGSNSTWRSLIHPAFGFCPGDAPNFRLPESNVLYDARHELAGWTSPSYDDSGWGPAVDLGPAGALPWGVLAPRPIPLWKPANLEPFIKVESQGGDMVASLPFNQRFTVWMDLQAPAGRKLDLATDTAVIGSAPTIRAGYITREGRQQFETFGWMSGRELRVTVPADVRVIALQFRPHAYDAAVLGGFRCSDTFLASLWGKAVRTLQIDMADSWMDCPDRERAPWPGDATIALGQAPYVLDARASLLSRKGLSELSRWVRADEVIYGPVPSGNWNQELPLQSLAAIGPYGPLTYFQHTGDRTLLESVYPAVKAYLLDVWQLDDRGLVVHRAGDWDWGDWGDNVDLPLLDNTWYLLALDATADMASLLGRTGDIPAFRTRSAAIRAAFNGAFWDGQAYRSPGHTGDPDERGNAMAVLAGLNGPDQAAGLLGILTRGQQASPYMERFVLEALCRLGHAEQALARIRQRYASMVASDNTTLFEVFPADGTPDHVWSGGVLTVLAQDIAGLRPTTPGWRTFEVMPQMGDLESLGLDTPTPWGLVRVDLQARAWGHSMHLRIPPGTSAVAGLPACGLGDVVLLNGRPVLGAAPVTGGIHRISLPPGTWDFAVMQGMRSAARPSAAAAESRR